MSGDTPDLRRFTSSVATPICGNPLTGSVPLLKTSLRWIRRPVLSPFLWKKTGQDQSPVPRTGRFCPDLYAAVCLRRLSMAQEAVGSLEPLLAGV